MEIIEFRKIDMINYNKKNRRLLKKNIKHRCKSNRNYLKKIGILLFFLGSFYIIAYIMVVMAIKFNFI